MREIVIPQPRPLLLRIVDRLAETTLLASIPALTALAICFQLGA